MIPASEGKSLNFRTKKYSFLIENKTKKKVRVLFPVLFQMIHKTKSKKSLMYFIVLESMFLNIKSTLI